VTLFIYVHTVHKYAFTLVTYMYIHIHVYKFVSTCNSSGLDDDPGIPWREHKIVTVQKSFKTVLKVHKLSLTGYLEQDRIIPIWPKSHANTLYDAL